MADFDKMSFWSVEFASTVHITTYLEQRISAYAGSEPKTWPGHIRAFNDRVHVRLVGVHANLLQTFKAFSFLYRAIRECGKCLRSLIFRRAPWCPCCALAVDWSAVAVRTSGWLSAGTSLTRGVSLGSGRGACRSLSIGTDFDCDVKLSTFWMVRIMPDVRSCL